MKKQRRLVKKAARKTFSPLFKDMPAVSVKRHRVCHRLRAEPRRIMSPESHNVSNKQHCESTKWSGAKDESIMNPKEK